MENKEKCGVVLAGAQDRWSTQKLDFSSSKPMYKYAPEDKVDK